MRLRRVPSGAMTSIRLSRSRKARAVSSAMPAAFERSTAMPPIERRKTPNGHRKRVCLPRKLALRRSANWTQTPTGKSQFEVWGATSRIAFGSFGHCPLEAPAADAHHEAPEGGGERSVGARHGVADLGDLLRHRCHSPVPGSRPSMKTASRSRPGSSVFALEGSRARARRPRRGSLRAGREARKVAGPPGARPGRTGAPSGQRVSAPRAAPKERPAIRARHPPRVRASRTSPRRRRRRAGGRPLTSRRQGGSVAATTSIAGRPGPARAAADRQGLGSRGGLHVPAQPRHPEPAEGDDRLRVEPRAARRYPRSEATKAGTIRRPVASTGRAEPRNRPSPISRTRGGPGGDPGGQRRPRRAGRGRGGRRPRRPDTAGRLPAATPCRPETRTSTRRGRPGCARGPRRRPGSSPARSSATSPESTVRRATKLSRVSSSSPSPADGPRSR